MTKTQQVTFDNLSLHAVTTPVACRRLTVREHASDVTPVKYNVAAPSNADTPYQKFEGEATVFENLNGIYQAGDTVGYIQPASGTITYDVIAE